MFYKNNKQVWSIRICKMSSSLRETKELIVTIVTIASEITIKGQALFSFFLVLSVSRVVAG